MEKVGVQMESICAVTLTAQVNGIPLYSWKLVSADKLNKAPIGFMPIFTPSQRENMPVLEKLRKIRKPKKRCAATL